MKKFTHFLFYNNTVPVAFAILFLGAGATFAASPEARESVVTSSMVLTSVDNSLLLSSDISDLTVTITINSVTEDADTYYVEYQMRTIDVVNGVWQPTVRTNSLRVDRVALSGKDLGIYTSEQLSQVHAAEIKRLKETKERQQAAGLSHKIITTEYEGLVGQFFDPKKEVFPEYDPVHQGGQPLSPEELRIHEELQKQLAEQQKRSKEQENGYNVVIDDGETVIIPPVIPNPEPESTESLPNPEPIPESEPTTEVENEGGEGDAPEPTPEPPVEELQPEPEPTPEPATP